VAVGTQDFGQELLSDEATKDPPLCGGYQAQLPAGTSMDMNLLRTIPPSAHTQSNEPARFDADRGAIVMRHTKHIGTFRCEMGFRIEILALTIITTKSSASPEKVTYGIRFEAYRDMNTMDSAFLEFDQAEEFSNAIVYMSQLAQNLKDSTPDGDHSEAQYSTKDGINIGLYRDAKGNVKAFTSMRLGGDSGFFHPDSLLAFRKLVDEARLELTAKGAVQVDPL
jgi:hypothetical protein